MRAWWLIGVTLALQACVAPRPPDRPPVLAVPTTPPAKVPRTPSAVDPRVPLFGIDEGIRNDRLLADSRANWQRLVVPWTVVQPAGPDDFGRLGQVLPAQVIEAQLDRGVRIAGLLQFTPAWAQADPRQGERSPPKNLELAFDDPRNYFARFAFETARFYAGRIDEWIIWNEPEFRPGEPGAGGSFTWLGTEEQYARLLTVAYLAIKAANPNALVSFAGSSYWTDELAQRKQYYERVLAILSRDGQARGHGFYHDAVSLNLYRSPDDLLRVHGVYRAIQGRFGLDKAVWLTETNAMPTDDLRVACSHAADAIRTTMDEQAAFAIQAFALAAAAGYTRIGFYQMVDDDPCRQPGVWGAARDDGSRRPVADALRTAIGTFSGARRASFMPLMRLSQDWPAWPSEPGSYVPNWDIYQVALDVPGERRVSVLWNGDAQPACAGVKKHGGTARVVDKFGVQQPGPAEVDGWWWVNLPPATAHAADDPDGYHFIGGSPVLLIEDGVSPTLPVAQPAVGCSGPGDFQVSIAPAGGQTVRRGAVAEFTIRARGLRGFTQAIAVRPVRWSTQRFPSERDAASLPLHVTLPDEVVPGRPAILRVETVGADTGIYYVTLRASAGTLAREVELALVVD